MDTFKTDCKETWACIRTGKGIAAIGSIEIEGPGVFSVARQCFQPAAKDTSFEEGKILRGRFLVQSEEIDEGLLAVEGPQRLVLHCHGNPLIARRILEFLKTAGIRIVSLEEMLARRFACQSSNLLEMEARLESLKSVSLLGVQLIHHQLSGGLSEVLEQWSRCADIETIRSQAKTVFQRSQIARRILRGVRIVIAGPPNSGKSTLLNRLTGGEQALVSDIQGTTRDWIAAFGRIEPLWIEWIDTAGLDEDLAGTDTLEQIAQQQTHHLLSRCDLILYVLDTSKPQWTQQLPAPGAIPLITVLNKYDLSHIDPPEPDKQIAISALCSMNLGHLSRRILQTLQVESFEPTLPAAFTERQIRLLEKLASAKNLSETKTLVQQLFGIGRTV